MHIKVYIKDNKITIEHPRYARSLFIQREKLKLAQLPNALTKKIPDITELEIQAIVNEVSALVKPTVKSDFKMAIPSIMKSTEYYLSSKKTPDYTRISMHKPKQLVKKLDCVYEHEEWDGEKYNVLFKLWEQPTAIGNPSKYLYTEPSKYLQSGKDFLAEKPMPVEDVQQEIAIFLRRDMLVDIAGEWGVRTSTKKRELSNQEIWASLIEVHKKAPIFFELPQPLSEQETEEVKKWDLDELRKDYLYEGMEKDEDLAYISELQMIKFKQDPYENDDVCKNTQPFNSHALIVAPTKRSKTWIAKKIGDLHTDASSAGLKGFATAKEVNIGAIDGKSGVQTFDNAHNLPLGQFAGVMELIQHGETLTTKGKQPVLTRTLSTFILNANPPNVEDPVQLAQCFADIVSLVQTYAGGAVGSRFAIPFFKPDAKKRSGKPYPEEIVRKNRVIFEYIVAQVNKEVETNIFPNQQVQDWLRAPNKDHLETIENFFANALLPIDNVKDFWLAHPLGYGLRGAALKRAIIENLKAVWLKEYDIDELLDCAEEERKHLQTIILEGLQKMLKVMSSIPYETWIRKKYDQLKYDLDKALVLAVAEYAYVNPQIAKKGTSIPLQHCENDYNNLQHTKPKRYRYLSQIFNKLVDSNLFKINKRIRFGFAIAQQKRGIFAINFIRDCANELKVVAEYVRGYPLKPTT